MSRAKICLQQTIHGIRLSRVISTAFAILISIATASTALATAAQVAVRSPISDLIGSAPVHSVTSDHLGYLWLNTDRSVYRVSGELFERFGRLEANRFYIPATHIERVFSSKSGDIYLNTRDAGIFKWNERNATFVKVEVSLPNLLDEQPSLFGVAAKGLLLIKQSEFLYLYDNINGNFHVIASDLEPTPSHSSSITITEGDRGNLYINTGTQLLGFNISASPSRFRVKKFASTDITKGISALFYDAKTSCLWTGDQFGQLHLLDPNDLRIVSKKTTDSKEANYIHDIGRSGDLLILATRRGLLILEEPGDALDAPWVEMTSILDSIAYDIHDLSADHWIATYDGIYTLSSGLIKLFSNDNSDIKGDVLSFQEGAEGEIWVGTSKGLFLFDEESNTHSSFESLHWKDALPSAEVTSMDAFEDHIWAGFHDGSLRIINTLEKTVDSVGYAPSQKSGITDIQVLDNGAAALVGTFGDGIHYVSNKETKESRKLFEGRQLSYVYKIILPSDGPSLILSESNVYALSQPSMRVEKLAIKVPKHARSSHFNSFALSSDTSLYLGTDSHGILEVDFVNENQSFKMLPALSFGSDSKLDNAIIYSIEVDDNGGIWTSSNIGIFYIDSQGDRVIRYTESDGLQSNEFTFGSSYKDSKGNIYFGGTNGYNVLKTESLSSKPITEPSVKILGFTSTTTAEYEDLTFSSQPEIVLSHRDNSFTVHFGVVSARSFRENTYLVELHGGNEIWKQVLSDSNAQFSTLSPGVYKLTVRAANSYGVWGRNGSELNIVILTPPWFTWWAFALYFLALAGGLWVVHRIYQSYITERRAEELTIEIEETRNRAEDEIQEQLEYHDELAQAAHQHHGSILHLLQHCLNTTLDEFNSEASSEISTDSPSYMQALALLENCTVYDEGDVSIDLRVFVEKLFPAIMPYCRVNRDTIITVNELTDDPFTLTIGTTLAVMIFELASNALAHAYSDQSPANYLRVISRIGYSKDKDEESLSIIVRDSGEGIPKNAIETAPPGSGIALVRSLAESINAEFSYSYDKGTMAKITLPLSQSQPIFA